MKTKYPYTVSTGSYALAQVEAEACALCGEPFAFGQNLRPVWLAPDFDLYAHEQCPEGVTTNAQRHG